MDRRKFVANTTLGLAGISASASLLLDPVKFKSPSETINIGIIGTGDRGGGLIPIIDKIPYLHVVACCDIIPFRLEEGLSKGNGKAKGYSDYRELLDDKDVDAVIVATPFSTHAQIAIDALDANKHVYCEKTLAKGHEGIEALLEKVSGSDKIFQTGHQYHSSRLYSHVVDEIKGGKIGKITAIECQWNRNGDWRRPVPDPKWEKQINWRMYREFSGGLLAELCSHQLDFANWVLNATPDKVMGMGGIDYWKDGRETFDNIHLIYSYPDGVKATFTCLTSNALNDYKIKVLGDKGAFILDYVKAWFHPENSGNKELGNVDGVSGATMNWEEGKGIPLEVTHADPSKQALIDFRDSIHNRKQPLSDVHSGAKTAKCVQMGLDAMYNNEIVAWS